MSAFVARCVTRKEKEIVCCKHKLFCEVFLTVQLLANWECQCLEIGFGLHNEGWPAGLSGFTLVLNSSGSNFRENFKNISRFDATAQCGPSEYWNELSSFLEPSVCRKCYPESDSERRYEWLGIYYHVHRCVSGKQKAASFVLSRQVHVIHRE